MRTRPFGAVLILRERASEDARSALGRALAVEDEARRRCEAVRRVVAAHARREAEARSGLGGSGRQESSGLQAVSRFLERLRAEALAIEAALRSSDEALRDAASAVERGRDLLAAARRDLREIERRRGRWDQERRREIERRIEDDAEDVVSARRGAP